MRHDNILDIILSPRRTLSLSLYFRQGSDNLSQRGPPCACKVRWPICKAQSQEFRIVSGFHSPNCTIVFITATALSSKPKDLLLSLPSAKNISQLARERTACSESSSCRLFCLFRFRRSFYRMGRLPLLVRHICFDSQVQILLRLIQI